MDIRVLLEGVCDELRKSVYLLENNIIIGFPAAIRDIPLRRSTIALSIGAVEVREGSFGQYFGVNTDGSEVFGTLCEISIKLDIAVPKILGGEVCHEVMSALTSAVLNGKFGGRVLSLKSGSISFERTLGAIVLPVTLNLLCIISEGHASAGESFEKITVVVNN